MNRCPLYEWALTPCGPVSAICNGSTPQLTVDRSTPSPVVMVHPHQSSTQATIIPCTDN